MRGKRCDLGSLAITAKRKDCSTPIPLRADYTTKSLFITNSPEPLLFRGGCERGTCVEVDRGARGVIRVSPGDDVHGGGALDVPFLGEPCAIVRGSVSRRCCFYTSQHFVLHGCAEQRRPWCSDPDHIALLGFYAAGNGVESRNRNTSCLRFRRFRYMGAVRRRRLHHQFGQCVFLVRSASVEKLCLDYR